MTYEKLYNKVLDDLVHSRTIEPLFKSYECVLFIGDEFGKFNYDSKLGIYIQDVGVNNRSILGTTLMTAVNLALDNCNSHMNPETGTVTPYIEHGCPYIAAVDTTGLKLGLRFPKQGTVEVRGEISLENICTIFDNKKNKFSTLFRDSEFNIELLKKRALALYESQRKFAR